MLYYPLDSTGANGEKLYRTIPDVELTAQNGKPFHTNSVKGKIVVTDFFFASCQGPCPRMTNQLTRVQQALRGDTNFRIVSYTVDPARDTANALNEYALRFKADTAQWKFITGDKKKLYDLARYSYFLPVDSGDGGPEDFIHSDQVILLDRDTHIRGYYSGTDSAAIDSLIVDIKTLLKQR
jgi:protein SCO1/2